VLTLRGLITYYVLFSFIWVSGSLVQPLRRHADFSLMLISSGLLKITGPNLGSGLL